MNAQPIAMDVGAMPFDARTARAARALLGWTQGELAEQAKLGVSTVYDFERERRAIPADTEAAIQRALEQAGVEFLDGDAPGVRLRKRRKS